jgi:hypothetical protein
MEKLVGFSWTQFRAHTKGTHAMNELYVRGIQDVVPSSDRGTTERHADFVIVALAREGPGSDDPVSIHLTNKAARELKAHLDRLLVG